MSAAPTLETGAVEVCETSLADASSHLCTKPAREHVLVHDEKAGGSPHRGQDRLFVPRDQGAKVDHFDAYVAVGKLLGGLQ